MSGVASVAAADRTGSVRSAGWVIRSEWTKLWSLRSTAWTLLATVVITVGVSILVCWALATERETAPNGQLDVTGAALSGFFLGQLPIAVLGVLIITGEYSSGSIRSSLTAVPGRLRLLTAKGLVIAVVAFVTGIVASFPSFFLGMAFFNAHDEGVGIGEPHVLRGVVGGALLLPLCALFGYGVGILMRHTAGAITVSVALLFLVPNVLVAIPADVARTVNKYFLSNAGDDIASTVRQPDTLGGWTGLLTFVVEVAALLVVAAVVMKRRDA